MPLLSSIPVLGPILFSGTPYLYIALATMVILTYMLFRTRWGLRLRASGEYPQAAGTVGIDVIRIRYRAMLLAGLLATGESKYARITLASQTAGSYLPVGAAPSAQPLPIVDPSTGTILPSAKPATSGIQSIRTRAIAADAP